MLLIALAVLIVSGVLAHPLHEVLAVKIIHKLAAMVFVRGIIGHGAQHTKARKNNTFVGQAEKPSPVGINFSRKLKTVIKENTTLR